MTRRRWIILLVLGLAAAAWFGWKATHRPDPAAAYTTQPIAKGDLSEAITANGVINPVRVVSVGTQVSGTVAKLLVDYNSRVTAGELLLELDPSVYAARLAASEANLANIRSSLALQTANARRSAELFKQNYISRQDYETAQQVEASAAAQVAAAEAQIKQDRTNLGYTIIRSPVSGVVISRQVDLGQTVAASFSTPTLFTIARDLTQMQIEAAVAEADVAKVRIGQPVSFTVDAYGNRNFTGSVRQIRLNPTTQQNVVTYTVIVGVANPDGALLPGMTANASFLVSDHKDTLLIPNAALSYKPADYKPAKRKPGEPLSDGLTVFVLKGSTPEPVRIKIGASDADNSIVTAGPLAVGDKIIIADTLKDKPKGSVLGPPSSAKKK
ncbi:efflux RND transporter periplasmic adaptor subunit [Polymorphobacter sp. PAMC 29334]|uniref:efflux RND transporter periplasmic adaptor subunit n=1 Tax=Polymorphobacter sp. PAMC 29334 TaxID=2862331 RepID=UPI001C748D54|nr:efflux RND transporter periplasmic adaptor subunit [Polymorphobacter sp. PAMC 29334]QYE34670.1 efflux RND transporter periplasmic adaptor subunit [Polymorphobacter sp. PAMC 29334]